MDAVRVDSARLQQFAYDILLSAGVDAQEALTVAEVLVWADLVGRQTHGVGRLPIYVKRFGLGLVNSPCNAMFSRQSETICIVEGNSGFGQYLGRVAMSRAIDIAKQYGVGLVGVRESNHFGVGAYYVQMAAQSSQIGFAFSNGFPRVAPYGGVSAVTGTNPFAFAAPTRGGKSVLVDMSTGVLAGATIREVAKGNKMLPEGAVVDESGSHVRDPKQATHKAILPFGGAKGYCLSLMVEIVAGVITGSGISHEVGSMYHNFETISNSGHSFLAIDISRLMPIEEFHDRMDRLIDFVKSAERESSVEEILIPGEQRWRIFNVQSVRGVELDATDAASLASLAEELSLCPPW